MIISQPEEHLHVLVFMTYRLAATGSSLIRLPKKPLRDLKGLRELLVEEEGGMVELSSSLGSPRCSPMAFLPLLRVAQEGSAYKHPTLSVEHGNKI